MGALVLELRVHEYFDARGGVDIGLEVNLDFFSGSDDRAAIGTDDASFLVERALPAAPSIDDAYLGERGGEFCDGESVENANQHELAIVLLPHVVAQQTCLQIWDH